MRAARGQLLAWRVRLRNAGRLPVTAMQITVAFPAAPGTRPGCGPFRRPCSQPLFGRVPPFPGGEGRTMGHVLLSSASRLRSLCRFGGSSWLDPVPACSPVRPCCTYGMSHQIQSLFRGPAKHYTLVQEQLVF